MASAPGGPRRAPVKDEEEEIPPPHAHAQEQAWAARASRRRGRASGRRSERALVRDAQAGSAEAFEELFRRHWPRAHRTAFLIVGDAAAAEDIAQEAFLAAVRALDRFDRRRPLGPWLSRIVANRAIDWARARAVRREVDAAQVPEAVARASEPTRPWSDAVVTALGALSPEHRAVIVLRHLLEYTPGEIARALELPRGTVNSRLRRGLDGLEAALREEAETS